ncbi:MAG: hypothetical protein AAFO07_25170 [Bacteroidota bacterium]
MKKEKELQKVTDFEQIVDRETFDSYVKQNEPSKELFAYLHDRLSQAYGDPDLDESVFRDIIVDTFDKVEGTRHKAERIKNLTYEVNHQKIGACIHNHIVNHRLFPRSLQFRKRQVLVEQQFIGILNLTTIHHQINS